MTKIPERWIELENLVNHARSSAQAWSNKRRGAPPVSYNDLVGLFAFIHEQQNTIEELERKVLLAGVYESRFADESRRADRLEEVNKRLTNQLELIRYVQSMWSTVVDLFGGDRAKAREFMDQPNSKLNGKTPMDCIQKCDFSPIETLIAAMKNDNPGAH